MSDEIKRIKQRLPSYETGLHKRSFRMGNVPTIYSAYIGSPDTSPNVKEPPTFDPLYGFPNGRAEREAKVTEDELIAAGIPKELRDYCGHHYLEFYQCRRQKFPYVAACKPIYQEWEHCEFEDYLLRMKEYERERRLLVRAKRKARKESAEMLED